MWEVVGGAEAVYGGSSRMRFRSFACTMWLLASSACDPPSAGVDAGDLLGVFDDAGAASSSPAGNTAKPRASATAAPTVNVRDPGEPSCVEERGTPEPVSRTIGRPACQAATVFEWKDGSGSPRYACLYAPPDASKRTPLPLLVYFHGSSPGLDDPSSISKLTSLRSKAGAVDLSGDPLRRGYFILGVQGRLLGKSLGATFDTSFVSPDNLDKLATDRFVDMAIEQGLIDPKRIYAVGMGKGAEMAATYAMLRADRVAAFAAYAPSIPPAKWSCPGPPPPGIVLYRACDTVTTCDEVEGWLRSREGQNAATKSLRLGDDTKEEPNCAVKQKCSKKKGEAHHYRWPKGREKDLLAFFAQHALR